MPQTHLTTSIGQPSDTTGRRASPRSRLSRFAYLGALVFLLASATSGCLSPEFLNQQTGLVYPTAPGDQSFVLVRVVNDTPATLDIPISWDDGIQENTFFIEALTPEGRETGVLIQWPVLRVGLGDLDSPATPSIVASFPDGGTSFVPFGLAALERNVDFENGDTVVFFINEDVRSDAFISVDAGLVEGEAQAGQAFRADPFETVRLLLTLNGF